jgi:hypothetical protein
LDHRVFKAYRALLVLRVIRAIPETLVRRVYKVFKAQLVPLGQKVMLVLA